MKSFICHCTVGTFDMGFMEGTTARPTIVVEARNQEEAIEKAEDDLTKQYTGRLNRVTSVSVNLIKEI